MVFLAEATDSLGRLTDMRDKGLISESEFLKLRTGMLISLEKDRQTARIISLGKILAWPFVVVMFLILISFGSLDRLSELEAPGFKVKLKEAAEIEGVPQLGATLGELSGPAIELLLSTGSGFQYFVARDRERNLPVYTYPAELQPWEELESAGLALIYSNGINGHSRQPEKFSQFLAWIFSIGEGVTLYSSEYGGKVSFRPSAESMKPLVRVDFSNGNLSEADRKRLLTVGGDLTDEGLKARALLISVVAKLVSKAP